MWLKGYAELRHGSTITWDYHYPAAANPFIDDNIKFAQFLHLKHDLFDMNRMDKCRFLAQACKGEDKPFVRVCEEQIVANCGKCQKCMRTILEFSIVGENPKEYGFTTPVDQVLKKTRKFMAHHTTGSTTVWHFKHMQQYLQEQEQRGIPIHEDLKWMLTANLDKKVTSDIKGQKQLDWHDFIDLLPDIELHMYVLVALALTQLAYAKVDLLTSVTAQKNSLRITINEEFKKKYLNEDFFADYDSDINLEQFDYSVLSLPCIMNLISLVWISGKTYYIEEMDTEIV